MTEPLAQAKALMVEFKAQVEPGSEVTHDGDDLSLSIPVVDGYAVLVWTSWQRGSLRIGFSAPALHSRVGLDGVARIGGTFIQVSNLVRQIRALTGGSPNDSDRVQAAVR